MYVPFIISVSVHDLFDFVTKWASDRIVIF